MTVSALALQVVRGAVIAGVGLALAAVCSACSVYDPRRLAGRGENPIATHDAGVEDASDGDAQLVVDCRQGLFARCSRPHAEAACVDEVCIIERCLDGFADCDTEAANGCEARLDSAAHCGLCGARCRYSRASARCVDGRCELGECDAGFGDCDGDPENGCETALTEPANCGSCGYACPEVERGLAGCAGGTCAVTSCLGPYGDCNGAAADGCEQPLDTAEHCGACDAPCAPAHGSGRCVDGSCVITDCDPGFADCNGLAADGCEKRTDALDDCGGCGRSCALAHVARPRCEASGTCAIDRTCDPEDPACTPDAATSGCETGFADCDGEPGNGCETNLSRLGDCGACGNSCVRPNTVTACRDGGCEVVGCAPGAERCDGEPECRRLDSDPRHCGACGQACADPRPRCAGGRCTDQTCGPGRADCDQDEGNGCEVDLDSAANCGACGRGCPDLPHATSACDEGSCAIGRCDEGFRDCDGDVSNGCEVDVRTADDCGDCATPCFAPEAVTSCATGECRITSCEDMRGDCNGLLADGCEADFTLPASCGGCENVCAALPNVASSSCEDANCRLVCGEGRADCDGRTANGCEAELTDPTSCGRCGNDCERLANVRAASCVDGSCHELECERGFADCNGDPADGCERALNTSRDCGACGRSCAPAHAQGVCDEGTCRLASCDRGFDDCNGLAADGCETALTTGENCGACGNTCGGGACNNGQCGCTTDADCGDGLSCCGGACVDIVSACFPFPCIPGTDRAASGLHCGGCDVPCLLWCCDNVFE